MEGRPASSAAAGTGVLKQLIFRAHAKPEGPTLSEFKAGIATRFHVQQTHGARQIRAPRAVATRAAVRGRDRREEEVAAPGQQVQSQSSPLNASPSLPLPPAVTVFDCVGTPVSDDTRMEELWHDELLLNVIDSRGALTPWVMWLEGEPPAAHKRHVPHITGGSIAAQVLMEGGHGRGLVKAIHYRAELPAAATSVGELRALMAARYNVPPAGVTLQDLTLSPLPADASLAALYAGPAGGKLIARVTEAAGGLTTWVLQLSAAPMPRVQFRLAKGTKTAAPTEGHSAHHRSRKPDEQGAGAGAAAAAAAAPAPASSCPASIEGGIIMNSHGAGVLKRLIFKAPLAVKG